MHYRLKDEYILRGWEKLPYAVIDTRTGDAAFLTSQKMKAIELCDGNIDVSSPFIPDDLKELIAEAEKLGVVEPCKAGEGLSENQQYKKYPNRYIRDVHWAITGKCNFRCKHCFISIPNAPIFELNHDKIMNIINQLAEAGVFQVSLTGGEPFIRDDFFEIIDALTERNITISWINTNGSFITEKVLNEFAKRNVRPLFMISYDGFGWHDWLRGVPGAEEKVNRVFELCRDMGFPVQANMVIHKGNSHVLRESINHLASIGVKSIKTLYAANVGEWLKRNGQGAMSIEDMCNMYLEYIPHYYEDGMPMNIEFTSFFRASKNFPDRYGIVCYKEEYNPLNHILCGAIRNYAYISPDGRVLPCTVYDGFNIRENYPTLFEKSFAECVSAPDFLNLVTMTTSKLHEANEKCRTCKFNKHCDGGCRPSLLYLGEKDLMAENKIKCALFYGGWVKKIVDAVKKARPSAESPVKDLSMLQ
ncbi:MAG: radical SAM protein [Synergistaceae bacterium]|nr:radical SAM protein [Synergistaceae bacterium]